MAKHFLTMAMLIMLVFPAAAFPEEAAVESPSQENQAAADQPGEAWPFPPAQHFTLDPFFFTYAGYRFTGFQGKGSLRAAEFDYLHDSPAGGLDLHYYPLPLMLDVDFDIKNQYDHDAGVVIRYKDMIKIDYRNMGLFHNLDHYTFTVPGTDTDPKKRFGVKVNDNDLTLTLKSPGRPYWLYLNLREFTKDGSIQLRLPFEKSVVRDIDWSTRELTAGISGNVLDIFELDYHHTLKRFESKLRSFVMNFGQASTLIPTIETNLDTISLHTNLAKPINASATFTWGEKDNKFSGAKVDFSREYADVTYRPMDNMMVAVKYGHQSLDVNNPDVQMRGAPFNLSPPVFVSRESMSTTRDKGVVAVSYYPFPKLLLQGKYQVSSVERRNFKEWNDDIAFEALNLNKGASITHTGTVSATFTPVPHSKVRASYSYSYNGDPSYIVDSFRKSEGYVWATWVPTPGLTLNGQWKITRSDNPVRNPQTSAQDPDQLDRHVFKDTAGAGVTWFAVDGLVLGAHYDYFRFKAQQNIIFDGLGTNFRTPYWDTSHACSAFAKYCFRFPLDIQAEFQQSWSRGMFRLQGDIGAAAMEFYDTATDQKIRETKGTVKADYEIYKGWGTSFSYGISQFKDLTQRVYTGERTGIAHYGSAMLTKVW